MKLPFASALATRRRSAGRGLIPKSVERKAFSLVEVTIALGVAAFCLLAILGLLQTGLTSEKTTVGKTVATGLLSTVFTDLISTAPGNTASRAFQISLASQAATTPQTLYFSEAGEPTGVINSPPTSDSRYRVTVGIQSAPAQSQSPAQARILVTWPAGADPLPAQWPSKSSGSVEVVTWLDRS